MRAPFDRRSFVFGVAEMAVARTSEFWAQSTGLAELDAIEARIDDFRAHADIADGRLQPRAHQHGVDPLASGEATPLERWVDRRWGTALHRDVDDDRQMPETTNRFDLVEFETRLLAARLERAVQHYESFGEIWGTYLDAKPHGLLRMSEADGTVVIRLRRTASLPVELSIVFGELLYELRSALDNCLYAVAVITSGQNPPPNAGRLEWPIRSTAAEWASQASRYRDLPPEIVNALTAIQPYQAQAPSWNSLALLHDLARVDRHRSPHRLGLYLAHLKIVADKRRIEVVRTSRPGLVEEGDEVVCVRLAEGAALSPDIFDLDLEFDVEVTDVRESPGPSGHSGRPWGSLDNRLRALIQATKEYAIDLIDIAGDYVDAKR